MKATLVLFALSLLLVSIMKVQGMSILDPSQESSSEDSGDNGEGCRCRCCCCPSRRTEPDCDDGDDGSDGDDCSDGDDDFDSSDSEGNDDGSDELLAQGRHGSRGRRRHGHGEYYRKSDSADGLGWLYGGNLKYQDKDRKLGYDYDSAAGIGSVRRRESSDYEGNDDGSDELLAQGRHGSRGRHRHGHGEYYRKSDSAEGIGWLYGGKFRYQDKDRKIGYRHGWDAGIGRIRKSVTHHH